MLALYPAQAGTEQCDESLGATHSTLARKMHTYCIFDTHKSHLGTLEQVSIDSIILIVFGVGHRNVASRVSLCDGVDGCAWWGLVERSSRELLPQRH